MTFDVDKTVIGKNMLHAHEPIQPIFSCFGNNMRVFKIWGANGPLSLTFFGQIESYWKLSATACLEPIHPIFLYLSILQRLDYSSLQVAVVTEYCLGLESLV